MEVLKQTTSQPIDGIFICCGGGGLLSGVGAFIKAVAPHIKIYGVETADAAGRHGTVIRSLTQSISQANQESKVDGWMGRPVCVCSDDREPEGVSFGGVGHGGHLC